MRKAHTMGCARAIALGTLVSLGVGCKTQEHKKLAALNAEPPAPSVRPVDAARIAAADQTDGEAHNWLSPGRTYGEQRYSPLAKINRTNISQLGLAWYYDIEIERGMEATPLVIDGRMYTTSGWSLVFALDAKTGEELWTYDPKVPRDWGRRACCDVVNRGVAAWSDKIYVGTIDGRLVALKAQSGEVVWDVNTIDRTKPYTITMAPRVVKGKVIIGNGGAELGVRGYVSAYDAETGQLAWRFYTVPGDPSKPFEDRAMQMAAQTWTGEWFKYGGGGTVWDSMAYDPELDLLYIGVGNGSPWNRDIRSPGGGDNLFLSSIVALNPDTGAYVWHYQTTPGDSWDFTATQHIMLLDLTIEGTPRKVLVQAPKNGFFYVIDRTNGKLISAKNYVPVTWATHVDPATGRPVETKNARYPDPKTPNLQFPGPFGGHNWHPMAYSPRTGLVYLSAQELPFIYQKDAEFKFVEGEWNLGAKYSAAALPEDPAELSKLLPLLKGRLLAWDPVKNEKAFSVEHPGPWNGGVLATAGGLLFQGTPGGAFAAYRDDNGEKLWSVQAQTGVVAGPISYQVDGEQYLAVSVGWGTVFGLIVPGNQRAVSRVLAFRVGGNKELAPRTSSAMAMKWPAPAMMPALSGTPAQIAAGKETYLTRCVWCHGDAAMSAGVLPDLRMLDKTKHAVFNTVVLEGTLSARGMPGFKHLLSADDVEAVRQYVIKRAHDSRPKTGG